MTVDGSTKELVVLIHGTFATSEKDDGEGWWQRGSKFWNRLVSRLPVGIETQNGPLYRWTGWNTQRARFEAATSILDYLNALEERKQPYHLVAHSHGGTALWDALVESVNDGKELKYLKTWTTVATPFLLFTAQHSTPFYEGILFAGFSVCICMALSAFALYVQLRTSVGDLSELLLIVPFLIMYVVFIFFFFLAHSFYIPYIEARHLNATKSNRRFAMRKYGDRWLGLWSPDDEAINGLRMALNFKSAIEPELKSSRAVFKSDDVPGLRKLLSQIGFISRLMGLASNRIQNTMIDKTVRVLAHGDDRATALLEAVAVGPIDAPDSSYPHLPNDVVTTITQKADKAASDYAPTLRAAIGLSALGSAFGLLRTTINGSELVHTSYFENDDVLELIVLHIASSGRLSTDRQDSKLEDWLCSFKESVKSHVIDGPPCA